MADKIKLALALLIVACAMVAFYQFPDQSLLLRVIGLLVAATVASMIALKTEAGASTWSYGRGAVIEVRKVVWPTGKETRQTTLIVMLMVVLVGIILWFFDLFLVWAVKLLTGQGG
jgi:preprotein translocase subunit SecE